MVCELSQSPIKINRGAEHIPPDQNNFSHPLMRESLQWLMHLDRKVC